MHPSKLSMASMAPLNGKSILVVGDIDRENERLAHDLFVRGANVVWPKTHDSAVSLTKGNSAGTTDISPREVYRPACNLSRAEDVSRLAQFCADTVGGLDAVVVNFGDHGLGQKLTETSINDCEALVTGEFLAHVLLARIFTKVLSARQDSAYILVNDHNSSTICGGSLRSTVGAGEIMLAKSLAFETGGRPHVYSLILSSYCDGSEESGNITSACLGEAVALIVRHPSEAKDRVVIESNWREILDPTVVGPVYQSSL